MGKNKVITNNFIYLKYDRYDIHATEHAMQL